MTTIHANSPRDSVARLEQMVGMAGFVMSENSIRAHIASAIRIIVQLQRFPDGHRRVTGISEVTGIEGAVVQMQELLRFIRSGSGGGGAQEGEFRATGLRPVFLDALAANGAHVPERTFHPGYAQ